MSTRRWLAGVWIALLTANSVTAQNVSLTEAPLAQRFFRNELSLELTGKMTVKQDGKDVVYPHQAQARHEYLERCLEADGSIGAKAARSYAKAERAMRFDNSEPVSTSIRRDRRFLVAQRIKDQVVTFSPKGTLTRDEADLTEHFDTMAVGGLVPGKEVAVGKSWKLPNPVVAALCSLEGVTEHNLECTLVSVKDVTAQIKVVGKVQGIDHGAAVAILVNAECVFDTKEQCVVALEWKQADDRQQGPISPAISADVTIKLKRTPIAEPEELNEIALIPIPTEKTPPTHLTNIDYQDARKRFKFQYGRDWHVTSPDDSPQLVLRNVERGDFIAQVTLTPWKKVDLENVMPVADFAELMAETTGWVPTQETERKKLEVTSKNHHTVYRVIASGELNGVKTTQYFYLIVGQAGDQMIVTFSVVPQQVQRLGARDLELVRDIVLPEAAK